jgi:hypothetical protein
MYSKIGMGLLAAAGLTFGVVGTRIGGASPAPPVCTHDGGTGGSAASDGNASVNGDQDGAAGTPTDSNAGAEGNGSGLNGGTGTGDGAGNGSGDHNGSSPTPPTTNPGGEKPSASAVDTTFLDLRGHTDRTDVADGTATAPSTHSHLTGESRTLSRLLRIDGHAGTH